MALEFTVSNWPKTFKQAVCDKFGCTPENYEEKVFWKTLYWHSYLAALLLFRRNPRFFREDIELIRELSAVQDPEIFRNEINRFHGRNLRDKNWARRTFSIRISGKRLFALKNNLFNAEES